MKNLVVITAAYPYNFGEDFMDKEFREASKYYDKIVIYPLLKDGSERRGLPDNCEVRDVLLGSPIRKLNLQSLYLILGIYCTELFRSANFFFVLTNFRSLFSSIRQSLGKSDLLKSDLQELNLLEETHYYSVWMNDGASILSILKKKKSISNVYFRLHGYDLFDERRAGKYMPLRVFNFKWANKVFVLSQAGFDYIKNKNIYPSKLQLNYSGLYDNGRAPFNPLETFTVISCSNMHAFKRVDWIAQILKKIEFPINWIHFGDGDQMSLINNLAKEMPSNVNVNLKGRVANKELIQFYKENHVNLFIHLSITEGLGMGAVEAMSFGIPSLSINVGGVKEVVNSNTGILMELNSTKDQIQNEILKFKVSEQNTIEFREKVKAYFNDKFEASKNYKLFFQLFDD